MARSCQCKMTEGCLCISQPRQSIIGPEKQCHTQLECDYRNRATGIWKNGKSGQNASQNTFFPVKPRQNMMCAFWRGLESRVVWNYFSSNLSANIRCVRKSVLITYVVRIFQLCFIFRSSRSAQILLPPKCCPFSPNLLRKVKWNSLFSFFFLNVTCDPFDKHHVGRPVCCQPARRRPSGPPQRLFVWGKWRHCYGCRIIPALNVF